MAISKHVTRISWDFILILLSVLLIIHWVIDYPKERKEFTEREEYFSLGVYIADDVKDFVGHVRNPFGFFQKEINYDDVKKNELFKLKAIIELYRSEEGYYPTNLKELIEKKYMVALPRDPETKGFYYYELNEEENSYFLEAILSSGESYYVEN